MSKIKTRLLGLLVLLLLFTAAIPGQAAEHKKAVAEEQSTKPKAPIVIVGDDLSFNDLTGQVYAKGNVKITQDDAQILTDYMHGNTKENEVWIDGSANFLQPSINLNLTGIGTQYNYQNQTGTMKDIYGIVGRERVTGKNMDMLSSQEVILHNGTMTTCPAKVPDYHISAERIEIWPGDKLIAYNPKFWIKDKLIFTLTKYQASLKKGDQQSLFPRFGYNSKDGFSIRQYIEYPLSDKVAVHTDIDYYTRAGFKPQYGIIDRERNYSFGIVSGDYYDTDNAWIKKEPEFQFNYYGHRLANLPVSYTFTGTYGKWTDDYKTSWHQDYNLYFSRDPIKLSKLMTLYTGAGVEKILESYDSSTQNILRFDATIYQNWSPKWTTWTGYHYTKNNVGLFDYNSIDLGRELDTGFSYRIDKKNALAFNQSYDLQNQRVHDQDYTWNRDLHCWQAAITYRAKRQEWKVDFSTTRW